MGEVILTMKEIDKSFPGTGNFDCGNRFICHLEIQFFLIILVGKTHEIVVAVLVFQSA